MRDGWAIGGSCDAAAFLIARQVSAEFHHLVANSLNPPSIHPSSGSLRRGIKVAIIGLGIGFLVAFTGLWPTDLSRSEARNGTKSTIGKTGEMKSPGGSAYTSER